MRNEILLVGFLLLALVIAGCTTGKAASENFVNIPLSDLSENVQFYSYEDRGVKINYFAVLGPDGKPRTAFDACDVCGGYKGYQQQGEDIRCRNCGRVFSIQGLGTKNKGYGCWPSYLQHEVNGDNILIKISDITKGRHRFA